MELQSQDCLLEDAELSTLYQVGCPVKVITTVSQRSCQNCRGGSECKSYFSVSHSGWTGECAEKVNRRNELTVDFLCGQ